MSTLILVTDQQDLAEARFARHFREVRVGAGVSQREVAERMVELGLTGWLQSTVAKTEAGERPIRLNEFEALCQVLDLEPGMTMTIVRGPRIERNIVLAELRARISSRERDIVGEREHLADSEAELERLRTKLANLEADT